MRRRGRLPDGLSDGLCRVLRRPRPRGLGRAPREGAGGPLRRPPLPRFGAVYVLSPSFVGRLAALGVDADLLPLGTDLGRFHPHCRDRALRARLGATGNRPLLIYAGRLDSEKRPLEVIEAFRQLPEALEARLVLAGDGPQRAEVEAAAAEIGGGRVHVLGFVSDRDYFARLLASSDVYVSAMPHETFGISVVEAQASGLPVVGVRSGAMIDRVPEDLGRLVPVGDAVALAEGVRAVLAERPDVGRRARAHVEARFSWNATFRQLLGLYERVLASRRGRPVPIPTRSSVETASTPPRVPTASVPEPTEPSSLCA